MTTLTFTIASIYDPKEGKKTGSIKTTSDKWISYWPSDKGQFVAGNSYSAVCSTREWEGKTYFTVNSPGKNGNITNTGNTPTLVAQNAPQQAPTPSHGVAKDEIISRLAIAQADADSWMAWVEKRSEAPQSPQQMEQPQDDFGDTDIPF